jgi:hypothetical protein
VSLVLAKIRISPSSLDRLQEGVAITMQFVCPFVMANELRILCADFPVDRTIYGARFEMLDDQEIATCRVYLEMQRDPTMVLDLLWELMTLFQYKGRIICCMNRRSFLQTMVLRQVPGRLDYSLVIDAMQFV